MKGIELNHFTKKYPYLSAGQINDEKKRPLNKFGTKRVNN